jgi:hypothetical protein
MGPMFSREISELSEHIGQAGKYEGAEAWEHVSECINVAREKGADINRWLKARAVIAVFGAATESLLRKVPFQDVLEGYEAEDDVRSLYRDCELAGASDEFEAVMQGGVDRVRDYLLTPEVVNAVNALTDHIHRHGSTSGKRAAKIIRNAMVENSP